MSKISSDLEKIISRRKYQGKGAFNKYLNYFAWILRANHPLKIIKLWPRWNRSYDWYCRYFEDFKSSAPKRMVDYGGYQTGLPNGTAASLESLLLFSEFVRDDYAIILNCGAGVSSFFLRKFHRNVICCDPDEEYLTYVKGICKNNNLDGGNFVVGLDNAPAADYTFYDYGEIGCLSSGQSIRKDYLQMAASRTRALLYVDDADTRDFAKAYRNVVVEFCKKNDYQMQDASAGIDKFGRWGVVIDMSDSCTSL